MPKTKTHKGATKRCKVTAGGKVMSASAGNRHLASCKTRKRKRSLRGTSALSKPEQARVKVLLRG